MTHEQYYLSDNLIRITYTAIECGIVQQFGGNNY